MEAAPSAPSQGEGQFAHATVPTRIPGVLADPELRFILVKRPGEPYHGRASLGKEPFEDQWETQNNYAFDHQRLLAHLSTGGNYGVVAGYGHLIMIDADTDDVIRAVEESLPATFTVKTGKGRHFYYKCPDLETNLTLDAHEGGEKKNVGHVQVTRKQCVGPGSVHQTGRRYEVLHERPIATVSAAAVRSAVSPWTRLEESEQRAQEERSAAEKHVTDLDSLRCEAIVGTSKFLKRGSGYQGPHPVHGSDTGANFTIDTTKNVWHCFRHGTGGGAIQLVAVVEGIIPCDDAKREGLRGDKFRAAIKIAAEKYGLKLQERRPRRTKKDEGEDPGEIATRLMAGAHFRTLNDTEEVFYYEGGIYHPFGEAKLRELVEKDQANAATIRDASEVLFHVRARTYISRSLFTPLPDEVWVANGIFNVLTGELKPFTPDRPSLAKFDYPFDPKADCPSIKKFLSEVLYPEDVSAVQELFGYFLLKDHRFQKAFMFVGEGANGKSTLIALMKAFLGKDNVSCVSLQEVSENKFAMATLYQKMANLYPDLTTHALKATGQFKALTGGDAVTAEHKYAHPFTFVNYAKMVFSANQLPKVPDQTDAFFRRWIIFTFPNQFVGAKADPNLGARLTTAQELSGLLNWAVEGLRRLLAAGDFSRLRSIDEVRETYERMASPLHAFIMDMIIQDSDSWIPKDEFYDAYAKYCREKQLPPTSKNVIGREISQYISVTSVKQRTGAGARVHIWKGIRFQSQEEREVEIHQATLPDSAAPQDRAPQSDEQDRPPDNPPDYV